MKSLITTLLALGLVFSLNGCVIVAGDRDWDDDSWQKQQTENRELISQLALNAERNSVIAKLGAPSFSDAFIKDGAEYRVLYYRTQHTQSDGETTKDGTTPLVFKNDQLIGWGEESLANIR